MQFKQIIWLVGLRWRWSTESQINLLDGLNKPYINKEGQQAMNRDEGSFQLSHAYDPLSWYGMFPSCQGPQELVPVPASSDEGFW